MMIFRGVVSSAKSHFSELVKRALLGEEIVIARDNKPILRLTPVAEARKGRQPGSGKGQILAMTSEPMHPESEVVQNDNSHIHA
jgi:prevent-host-death family protein